MSTNEKQEGDFKMKKPKAKQLGKTDEVVKVDLKQPKPEEPIKVDLTKEKDAVQEQKPESSVLESVDKSQEDGQNPGMELQSVGEENQEETPIIQEITEEEVQEKSETLVDELSDAIDVQQQTGKALPENVEKLVAFMEETGGTVEDYVRLNADYSNINEVALLKEYYAKTKPYLDSEDVNLLLEDFSWDEELDDERDIRKRKLAFKEEVGKARNFLNDLKSKYYDEIKLRPGVTQEQQKAMDFFNRYNKEQSVRAKQHEAFKNQTKQMFNNEFKGFDFNLGEKKFRYGIQNPFQVAETQSDISNVVGKFLDKNGNVTDPAGYHKAMYAAMNADKLASHFYEQGKADATKEIIASSKNPSTEARKAPESVFINGLKVKSVSGLDSSKLKIKTKKFN